MSVQELISALENDTGINNVARNLQAKFDLIFEPKKIVPAFTKDFNELRQRIPTRVAEVVKELQEQEKTDDRLKNLELSQKNQFIYQRVKGEIEQGAVLINEKYPGVIAFLNGAQGKPSNIKKKLLQDQNIDFDNAPMEIGKRKGGKRKAGKRR